MKEFVEMMLQRRGHDRAPAEPLASPIAALPVDSPPVKSGSYFLLEEYGAVDEILARKPAKSRRRPANFDGS